MSNANIIKVALLQQSYVKEFNEYAETESNRLESWQFELSNKMLEKTKAHIIEASKYAELILLQELHTTQYFCQIESTKYLEFASKFNDHVAYFSNIAKECNVVLVCSLFEERAAGIYHNSAVVFEKDGTIAGKYRKMHIPDDPQFYEKFYFSKGDSGFMPIQTSVGKLGILICWDQWFPEAARIMSLNGADMLIYPTAIGWFDDDTIEEKTRQLQAWETIQRGHAIANGIPVLSINRVGFEKNPAYIPNITQQTITKGIRFFGNSFACGPQGEILAKASNDKEEIIYTEIDLYRTREVRNIWPFFRDRRIEHYSSILKLYGL